mmetsp:Transcript_124/g.210  ORF Transcript_124/g.210 Transcript_124/m.210 type:complete len:102 (-) Transcript_124:1550-1855(-)
MGLHHIVFQGVKLLQHKTVEPSRKEITTQGGWISRCLGRTMGGLGRWGNPDFSSGNRRWSIHLLAPRVPTWYSLSRVSVHAMQSTNLSQKGKVCSRADNKE